MIFGIFNSLLFGVILISLLDFILFLFLKVHYFNALKIDEFFNTIFVSNQNFVLLLALCIPVGYLFVYSPVKKWIEMLYFVLVVLFSLGFIPSIGQEVGYRIFATKDQSFTFGKTHFEGDILYQSKEFVYIKRNDIQKTLKIEKENLVIHAN